MKFFQYLKNHSKITAGLWIGAALLAGYGLMLPLVGIYGDDWGYFWLMFKSEGVQIFLRHNREATAPILSILAVVLGDHPLAWQIFHLSMRWLVVFLFWLILDLIWPRSRRETLLAAVLFALFPGYRLTYVPVNMLIFSLVLVCLLLSIYLNLLAFRRPRAFWPCLSGGLLLAYLNLTLTEYFFFTEAMRPILIFLSLGSTIPGLWPRIRRTFIVWLPYLLLFTGAIAWRAFNQSSINGFYTLKLLTKIQTDPLPALQELAVRIGQSIWNVCIGAWAEAFYPANFLQQDHVPAWLYIIVLVLISVLVGLILFKLKPAGEKTDGEPHLWLVWLGLGLVWCLAGGWPIWLAGLQVGGDMASTRFTLPFLPGGILVAAALPAALRRFPRLQNVAAALLIGSAAAMQILVGNSYRVDWRAQQGFYSQLYWRFGGIQPGNLIALNRTPTSEGEENMLSAAMNWFFSPPRPDATLDYYVYFIPEKFQSDNPELLAGVEETKGHHVGQFTAHRDQIVAIYIDPRNCLRVLYPGEDELNPRLSDFVKQMTPYSRPAGVSVAERVDTALLLRQMYGPEPEHDWCWAYQRADALRETGDWQAVSDLGANLNVDDFTQDWQKLALFIEADARAGRVDSAAEKLKAIAPTAIKNRTLFCAVSDRWLTDLNPQDSFLKAIQQSRSKAKCQGQ